MAHGEKPPLFQVHLKWRGIKHRLIRSLHPSIMARLNGTIAKAMSEIEAILNDIEISDNTVSCVWTEFLSSSKNDGNGFGKYFYQ